MRMNHLYLALAVVVIVLLAGGIAMLLVASSTRSRRQRMEEQRTRHLARQPWDAHAADGRGNR
jgi:type II secretory pathway pseudopilin PulG